MKLKNYRNFLLIIAITLILIPYLSVGLGNDEPFTMGVVSHSYNQILYLTSLDIHPPLYFLSLKLFLSLTTFWTSSIFVKIFFARLLSLTFAVISLIFIKKILATLNINVKFISSLLIFLVLPLELGLSQETTNIRMYSLTIMLFSIQMYYTIKYMDNFKNKHLLIIFIVVSASIYTQYVSGFISGLYLIFCFISFLFEKKFKNALLIVLIGILSLLSFVPWLQSFLKQMSYQQNPGSTSLMIKFLIEVIAIVLIFLVPYLKNKDVLSKNFKYIFFFPILIITLSVIMSVARFIISGGMISARYLSPVLVPYAFISIILLMYKDKNRSKLLSCIIIFFVTICMGISLFRQVNRYFIPQFSFISKFEKIKRSGNANVDIKKEHLNNYYWDQGDGGGGNAIYLLSINKKISNNNYMNTYTTLGNGNPKLFRAIFPNIKHFTDINPNKK